MNIIAKQFETEYKKIEIPDALKKSEVCGRKNFSRDVAEQKR